ncbi:MAG: ATP-binding cassette domain-containing protein [Desulfobacteraceae bacterium]|nr:MAG: ATP-binding cassette domain-containing protein [Desulfobacteraceae bacterium]
MGKRKVVFVEALVATFIINTIALATSLFSLQVYDRVIPQNGFHTLYVLGAGVLVAILLEYLLKNVRSSVMDRTSSQIDIDLSEWFFRRALGIRMESRPPSLGTFASQIKGLEFVQTVMSSASLFLMAEVPFSLFFIFVILLIGGWVAAVPLLFLPVALAAGLMFQRQLRRFAMEGQDCGNRKTGLLVEAIDGIESVKANGGEWSLHARWRELSVKRSLADYRAKHYSAFSNNTTVTLQQIAYVALVSLGAYLVAKGSMTMGGLIACTIISSRALSPIGRLPGLMVSWAQAKAAIRNLDKLIAQPNELDEYAYALNTGRLEPSIRMERVKFSYNLEDRPALELAGLDIKPGERVGVIGAIGSGKSTLLKLASGLYRPREGRVFMGGIDMALVSPHRLREIIAYVPQEIRLISGTLRDNLLQGLPDPGDEVLLEAARDTGLLNLITQHPRGLALPVTEGGRGISGGQKQLIGLTRMVLTKPSLLLLDEPTASMDSATEAGVVGLLDRMAEGATLIVATHKTAVLPILNRLLVFNNGMLAMEGPRDLVLARLSKKAPSLNKEAA